VVDLLTWLFLFRLRGAQKGPFASVIGHSHTPHATPTPHTHTPTPTPATTTAAMAPQFVQIKMPCSKRKAGGGYLPSFGQRMQKFVLPKTPNCSQFVGCSITGTGDDRLQHRYMARPEGKAPTNPYNICLPYSRPEKFYRLFVEGYLEIFFVDEEKLTYCPGYTQAEWEFVPVWIESDLGARWEFEPRGSSRLLVVAMYRGELITVPGKVLTNLGNLLHVAWERDQHGLSSWRNGFRRTR